MTQKALLIDNEYCTGCHSCELACRNELDLPLGQWGIKVLELGPWKKLDNKWEFRYVPILTSSCNLCEDRVAAGGIPSCMLHCLGACIEYGTVDELAKKMDEKGKMCTILIP